MFPGSEPTPDPLFNSNMTGAYIFDVLLTKVLRIDPVNTSVKNKVNHYISMILQENYLIIC